MIVLFIGDVVGGNSCNALAKFLPKFKLKNNVGLTVINGENSAEGNGITPCSYESLLSIADVITTGNHCYKRKEITPVFYESERLLRPANYGNRAIGKGYTILDFGGYSVAIVNIMGNAFMPDCDNPFLCIESLLKEIKTPNIIVDFHAEATSEKKAMGYFLAEQVSAVLGTHTHVQTADEQILANHTAFITDTGMTGVTSSVLGIEPKIIIEKHLTYFPQKHIYANGEIIMNAVLFSLDVKTGAATNISRIAAKIN
jgi:metallophosphoesterase (TIGR00282 family)